MSFDPRVQQHPPANANVAPGEPGPRRPGLNVAGLMALIIGALALVIGLVSAIGKALAGVVLPPSFAIIVIVLAVIAIGLALAGIAAGCIGLVLARWRGRRVLALIGTIVSGLAIVATAIGLLVA